MIALDLTTLGWHPSLETHLDPYRRVGCEPARVAARSHDLFDVLTASGPRRARVLGRYRHQSLTPADFPVVGDWVALRLASPDGDGVIEGLLPRRTAISRKAASANGRVEEQVVAANVDTVFLVSSLNREFNRRRIERYLVTVWESGAEPVIILNKADLCPDPERYLSLLGPAAAGVPLYLTSAASGQGLEALRPYLAPGRTVAFLGSSGVGKSSLINRLAGREIRATAEVRRSDQRGRHATSRSDLLLLPGGGLVVDTPGLRELVPWSGDDGLGQVFSDVVGLAAHCRFRDCRHEGEPGCSVQAALQDGRLEPERLAAYRKLEREQAFLRRRQSRQEFRDWRRRAKRLSIAIRRHERHDAWE